jgi:hypothetical protein
MIRNAANYGRNLILSAFASIASYSRGWGIGLISNLANGIYNAVSSSLRGAVDFARGILNRLNPWSKGSPSLIEQVASGVDELLKQYNRLSGLSIESPQVTPIVGANLSGLTVPGATAASSATTSRTVNYIIQPGQMIASKGEVRNFVRMLNDYQRIEEERLSSNEGQ